MALFSADKFAHFCLLKHHNYVFVYKHTSVYLTLHPSDPCLPALNFIHVTDAIFIVAIVPKCWRRFIM